MSGWTREGYIIRKIRKEQRLAILLKCQLHYQNRTKKNSGIYQSFKSNAEIWGDRSGDQDQYHYLGLES